MYRGDEAVNDDEWMVTDKQRKGSDRQAVYASGLRHRPTQERNHFTVQGFC